MKKKLALGLVVLFITVFTEFQFTGCEKSGRIMGTAPDISTQDSSFESSHYQVPFEIKLSHWSYGYTEGFEQAIKKYNDANTDNIKLKLLEIPQYRYDETLNMLMASGEGPDIIDLNEKLMNSYINRNWLINLSGYVGKNFLDRFPGWTVDFARDPAYGDRLYAITSCTITFRLIYNTDLFKASGLNPDNPPKTISELKDYAIRISRKYEGERKYGFALPAGDDWTGFVQSMEGPASYSGAYYFDYRKGVYDLTVYEPWLQALLDMKNNGGLFPGESNMKYDSARAQFTEGNIGMMFATSWDPAMLDKEFPAKCNWAVAMPPALDEASIGKGAVIMAAVSCYGINSQAIHNIYKVLKAWEHLYSHDFLYELYNAGAEIPVFQEIYNNPDYIPDIKNFKKFIPTDMDSPYPNTPKGFDEYSRLKAYSAVFSDDKTISSVLREESLRLNKDNPYKSHILSGIYSHDKYTITGFNPLNPLGR